MQSPNLSCLNSETDADFQARVLAYAQTVPDYFAAFEAVLAAGKDPVLPLHVIEFLKTSAYGPALGYRFARRSDLLEWVSSLEPHEAIDVLTYLAPFAWDVFDAWAAMFESVEETTIRFWRNCTIDSIRSCCALARLSAWSPGSGSLSH